MQISRAIELGVFLFTAVARSWAAEVEFESAGVRFGYSSAEGSKDFHQAEIFSELRLPWIWDVCSTNWHVLAQAEISVGWIGDGYKNAFVATAGPRLVLVRDRFPLKGFAGCNPTFMTREKFENRDFGIPLQFTSYAGVEMDIGKKFNLSYRFQHMSNGGLASPNPGLNLQMFSFSYRF